jgi:hypothetical protein|uniref:Uncharacterized protein n=1 Tax=Myoviridae sp. ctkfK18 TaxID=2825165 RepID=A0A8S5VGR9_9CAUD|nr:MAG TPA: hypothetical protein [Myoviridae sp. ctkfK18]
MEVKWINGVLLTLMVIFIIMIIVMLINTIKESKAEKLRNTDFDLSCKRIEGQLRKNGINIDTFNMTTEERFKWEQEDTDISAIIEEFREKHYTEADIKSILSHYHGHI